MKNQEQPIRSSFNRNIMLAIQSGVLQRFSSEKEFCNSIGIDSSYFSRLKTGQNDPSLDSIAKMLEALNIEVVMYVPRQFKVL